jgi:hypothetical protein
MSVGTLLRRTALTYAAVGIVLALTQAATARMTAPCQGEISRPLADRGILVTAVSWLPDLVQHVARGEMTVGSFLNGGYECRPVVASLDVSRLDRSTRLLLGEIGGTERTPVGGMGSARVRASDGTGSAAAKIVADAVTAVDTRAALVGTWEPDADLDLPPGSNHVIYLDDGIFINPFRNIALVGFWDATADSMVMAPAEIRRLDTGDAVPELKEMFGHIAWNTKGTSKVQWSSRDRYIEAGRTEGRRRVKRLHDIRPIHSALIKSLLTGAWRNPRNEELQFAEDGTYRQGATSGRHSIDGESGALALGNVPAQAIRWDDRNAFDMAGVRWQRSN